jgi:phage terminase large subunit
MTLQAQEILKDVSVTPVFEKNWNSGGRWVVNRGGTRSSKTTTLVQILISWLFFGYIRDGHYIPEGNAAVVRQYKSTLKATVMRDFELMLDYLDLKKYIDINRTDRTFRYGKRWVEFVGADDEQKLRGFKAKITWLNEANELTWKKEVFQLRVRTEEVIFVDFNPSDPYVWINEELEQKRAHTKGDVDVILSTYKDNASLNKLQIAEIESTKDEDLNYWKVYGLGEYGAILGLIIENATVVKSMPSNLRKRAFCMDFGYTNDPTTLLECGLQNKKDLYVDEYFYLKGMKGNDIGITLSALGVPFNAPIYADSSEPRLIDEMNDRGFYFIGAEKGPDSVSYGLQLLNQYNIFITERSINCIRERLKYRYKTDKKTGVPLRKPVDAFNHTWDAIRYYSIMNLKPFRPVPGTFRGGVV